MVLIAVYTVARCRNTLPQIVGWETGDFLPRNGSSWDRGRLPCSDVRKFPNILYPNKAPVLYNGEKRNHIADARLTFGKLPRDVWVCVGGPRGSFLQLAILPARDGQTPRARLFGLAFERADCLYKSSPDGKTHQKGEGSRTAMSADSIELS